MNNKRPITAVTINKSYLYYFVYSYRVPQLFYHFWCLTHRYWSVMGFTRNILYSLLDGYKYFYILSVTRGPQQPLFVCICQCIDCLLRGLKHLTAFFSSLRGLIHFSELFVFRGLIRLTVTYIEFCTGCVGILPDCTVRNYGLHLAKMYVC